MPVSRLDNEEKSTSAGKRWKKMTLLEKANKKNASMKKMTIHFPKNVSDHGERFQQSLSRTFL